MSVIYVSDLDGTLVDSGANLSAYSRHSLQRLLADGLPFTVASARSIVSIRQMLNGLDIRLPVICFNGAFLSDFKTGAHLRAHAMDADAAAGVFELLPQFGCVPYIATYDGSQEKVHYDQVINEGMQWYLNEREERQDPRWRRTSRLAAALEEQVIAMTVIHRQDVLTELETAIREQFGHRLEIHHFENEYSPGWYWLTLHDVRATKDQGIRSLREFTGRHDHRVVVFGDNRNDIKMFRSAHHAVAVANAVPDLKAHAHEVIGSNLEDSVVRYLEQRWPQHSPGR